MPAACCSACSSVQYHGSRMLLGEGPQHLGKYSCTCCSTPNCYAALSPPPQGPAGAAMQRLGQEGLGWVPTCCNLVALLCFGLCMVLNWKVCGAWAGLGVFETCAWSLLFVSHTCPCTKIHVAANTHATVFPSNLQPNRPPSPPLPLLPPTR